jgi:predicted RND superfamily exporter protein
MKRAIRKPSRIISAKQAFRSLGGFIEKRHLIFLILGLVLVVPSIIAATNVEMKTGFDTFVSSDSQAYKDLNKFNEHFSSDAVVVLITGDSLTRLLEPENFAAMDMIEEEMAADDSSKSVVGPVFLMEMIHLQRVLSGATTSMELPTDPGELAAMVIDPETNDIASELKNVFPDQRHALISVVMNASLTQDEQGDVVRKVEE